jgi:general secretion pathway protein J
MTRGAKGSGGFTLVEILVALGLLALTAALAWRGTAALVDGETRLAAEASRWRTLDAALARFEADVRQAIPRAVQAGPRVEPGWIAAREAGGSTALAFSRAGPEFAAEPGLAGQRIGYRLRSGAVEVVYWPGLDRPQPADEGTRAWPLIDGVTEFRVEHLDARGQWSLAWPPAGDMALPRALHVHLTLASGERIERWFALR